MKYVIEDNTLTNIADAIRDKTPETATMTPAQMATAIASITGGGSSDQNLSSGIIIPAVDIGIIYNQWNNNRLHIEHGLGVMPNLCSVWAEITEEEVFIPRAAAFISCVYFTLTNRCSHLERTYDVNGNTLFESSLVGEDYPKLEVTENEIIIGSRDGANLFAGRRYFWAAARIGAFVE